MDAHERRHALDYGHLALHIAGIFFVILFGVLVFWLVLSEPRTKLYESDNMVCEGTTFARTCFERKTR